MSENVSLTFDLCRNFKFLTAEKNRSKKKLDIANLARKRRTIYIYLCNLLVEFVVSIENVDYNISHKNHFNSKQCCLPRSKTYRNMSISSTIKDVILLTSVFIFGAKT
jgi:hypothetical protein